MRLETGVEWVVAPKPGDEEGTPLMYLQLDEWLDQEILEVSKSYVFTIDSGERVRVYRKQ
jgi:hypothetical protein